MSTSETSQSPNALEGVVDLGIFKKRFLKNRPEAKHARFCTSSYWRESLCALYGCDGDDLWILEVWYAVLFPFPRFQNDPNEFSGVRAIELLADYDLGYKAGVAVQTLLHMTDDRVQSEFLKAKIQPEAQSWIRRWLVAFDHVLRIEGVENNESTRKLCAKLLDRLDHLGWRGMDFLDEIFMSRIQYHSDRNSTVPWPSVFPKALKQRLTPDESLFHEGIVNFYEKELPLLPTPPVQDIESQQRRPGSSSLTTQQRYPVRVSTSYQDEEHPFASQTQGRGSSGGHPEYGRAAYGGQYSQGRGGYERPSVTIRGIDPPAPEEAEQVWSRTWVKILQTLQKDKQFQPDAFGGYIHIDLVFPTPKNAAQCRNLLQDPAIAFRLGYATTVLLETATALKGLWDKHGRDRNGPGSLWPRFERNIHEIDAIPYCMTILDTLLANNGVETDKEAKELCGRVLDTCFKDVPRKRILDAILLRDQLREEDRKDPLFASKDRILDTWFRRGMLVARELDRVSDADLEQQGVFWKYEEDMKQWDKEGKFYRRSNGQAWQELEAVRPKLLEAKKDGDD